MNSAELREWQSKLFGPSAMLPQICMELRMAVNGSSDPWSEAESSAVNESLRFLQARLDNWEAGDAQRDGVDNAVKNLVRETIKEVKMHLRVKKEANSPIPTWIAVKDQKPPADKRVLFRGFGANGHLMFKVQCDGESRALFRDSDYVFAATHWMLLE